MDLKMLLLPLGTVWAKIMNCLPAIVVEVEKAMEDGKIDPEERKTLALKAVDVVATEFGYRLNWFTKWVIGWAIDQIAKKLPSKSISVPDVVTNAVKALTK
jgi:hypothetical protein